MADEPVVRVEATTRSFARYGDVSTSLYGVSAIVLPAYSLSAGLGSKLSMWLAPPTMNSQITLLARGTA